MRLPTPADILPTPQTRLTAHRCLGPCNGLPAPGPHDRSLILSTFRLPINAVDLPACVLSWSSAITVDLPPFADSGDLLTRLALRLLVDAIGILLTVDLPIPC